MPCTFSEGGSPFGVAITILTDAVVRSTYASTKEVALTPPIEEKGQIQDLSEGR
jgi:hypothetical protein